MSSSVPEITRENSVVILSNSVRMGQKMGAFLLREVSLLKKAIDFFNPDVETKPDFGDKQDPEIVAINLLLQGVQKAQSHGGELAFSIDDAALLWDIIEFWMKEGGKGVAPKPVAAATPAPAAPARKSARALVKELIEEEDEDDNEIRVRPLRK